MNLFKEGDNLTIIYRRNKKPLIKAVPTQPGVSVITTTKRPDYINNVFDNFLRQSVKTKELVVIIHNSNMDIRKWKSKSKQYDNIKVYQLDESVNFGECKNFGVQNSNYNYIAIFDDDDFYAPNFLKYSLNVFKSYDCDIVGKRSCYMFFEDSNTLVLFAPDNENKFVKYAYVMDSSMVIKRDVFKKIMFPHTPLPEQVITEFQDECFRRDIKIFSTDKYNYLVHRRDNPHVNHTWKIGKKGILQWSEIIDENVVDYKKYIIK